ncbi:hypothetical protein BDY21DRAFT_384881 [Lineolata rhizophorae]|uniref:EKC/KEOPS complex subunit BUD32 n=1 Tax=Lineolata rhizophorae TaxID=578093 RepID=A0A6A6P5A7_9PEZI|nr:hypothetical protein BDY21DRAFT_384881 [Lineolata rhizophorae]
MSAFDLATRCSLTLDRVVCIGIALALIEILEKGAAFVEKGGDLEFSHTKLILKDGHQYFYAKTPRRCRSLPKIDIYTLELQPIPISHIWPLFTEQLTLAPEPLPANSFVKQHSLLDYGDTPASTSLSTLLLNEAQIFEVLRKHPHTNIVEYHGCLVKDERIVGLGFVHYGCTLAELLCLNGIENGIQHIHSLGLIHCDITPDNILMDGANARIGDFDSCHWEGTELGIKAGTGIRRQL